MINQIIFATSTKKENDELCIELVKRKLARKENDVLDRYYKAAKNFMGL